MKQLCMCVCVCVCVSVMSVFVCCVKVQLCVLGDGQDTLSSSLQLFVQQLRSDHKTILKHKNWSINNQWATLIYNISEMSLWRDMNRNPVFDLCTFFLELGGATGGLKVMSLTL